MNAYYASKEALVYENFWYLGYAWNFQDRFKEPEE